MLMEDTDFDEFKARKKRLADLGKTWEVLEEENS